MLLVSSISGALLASPEVAVYAVMEAYEKILACCLGNEMEGYGAGVSGLLPVAVGDTCFDARSGGSVFYLGSNINGGSGRNGNNGSGEKTKV